jgi:pre-mRNA-processing factor SLU7
VANYDDKTKTCIRNLRIREDTAKYLLNLDVKSAYYDPKSRSMRENPVGGGTGDVMSFKGDKVYINTGDTIDL